MPSALLCIPCNSTAKQWWQVLAYATMRYASRIERMPHLRSMSFGVLDAKGELYERTTFLLAPRLEKLEGRAREDLLDRIVIIDFSCQQAVSPYNILSRWPYTERDFFVTSRLETHARAFARRRETLLARRDGTQERHRVTFGI
jgi:hypothetical protein